MIDDQFKVWLIECNSNPCLETGCSLLAHLIPNMLDNVLNLAVDPYFGSPEKRLSKEEALWQSDKFNFELLLDGQ